MEANRKRKSKMRSICTEFIENAHLWMITSTAEGTRMNSQRRREILKLEQQKRAVQTLRKCCAEAPSAMG
jgi:hypothetical protein